MSSDAAKTRRHRSHSHFGHHRSFGEPQGPPTSPRPCYHWCATATFGRKNLWKNGELSEKQRTFGTTGEPSEGEPSEKQRTFGKTKNLRHHRGTLGGRTLGKTENLRRTPSEKPFGEPLRHHCHCVPQARFDKTLIISETVGKSRRSNQMEDTIGTF